MTSSINPNYAAQAIPGIPAGHVNVHAKIESNTTTEASDVLNNSRRHLRLGRHDPAGAGLTGGIAATDRFKKVRHRQDVLLLPERPRQAVHQPARARGRDQGTRPQRALEARQRHPDPGLLPAPAGNGRASEAPCPYGDPAAAPDIAGAKKLVQQSGMAGTPVTVWARIASRGCEWTENLSCDAERDRVQGNAEDDRRRAVLLDDRDAEEPSADRIRRLAAGLPQPDRLLPEPGRRASDRCRSGTPTTRRSTIRPSRRS